MRAISKILCGLALLLIATPSFAQRLKPTPWDTPASQCEWLDRGFVRINASATRPFISWRLLNSDDEHTSFLVLVDGEVKSDTLRGTTSFRTPGLVAPAKVIQLVTLQNGVPVDTLLPQVLNSSTHHKLQLDRPVKPTDDSKLSSQDFTYAPNDCSVGDVDGDGVYELFVKWYPSNAKDNSQGGYTGYTYLDCYRLFTGEKLWRINLGKNIRSGAHYTQFMVYDFDGDGKAEVICKTAPGTVDGKGEYVSKAATDAKIRATDNTQDHRTSDGRIDGGYEFLTVFNGETGAAIHTIPYLPNRNATFALSDAAGTFNWYMASGKSDTGSYGNRGERYLAGVAYLGGPDQNPSAVMCRGMYTRSHLWAVDFDGKELKTRWLHASINSTTVQMRDANLKVTTKTYSKNTDPNKTHAVYTAYAQGAHSLTIADVDGDGCDEIIYGSATINNDGNLLYSTGFGHGDALHISDMNPDRPGLEIFMVHEESPYGAHLLDAATGEVIWAATGSADNGRGLAANIFDNNDATRGYEFWSAKVNNTINAPSLTVESESKPSMNFRIFWDADPYDELLDGTSIRKYSLSGSTLSYKELGVYTTTTVMKNFTEIANVSACNGTKNTPCLQADIFGDWREEVIYYNAADPSQVLIFSTTEVSPYRVPTLMHDHNYRMAVAWQNTGYNQPPHIGYYLPDYVEAFQGVADEIVHLKGDVNEDGKVDINDVVAVINQMAGTATWRYANVNEDPDGSVDINDVVAIINIMAGQTTP